MVVTENEAITSCFWWETNGKHKSYNRLQSKSVIVSNNSVRLGYQFGLWSFQVPYPFKQAANASTNHDDVRHVRLMAHGAKQKKWGLSDWNWSVGAHDWMETWLVAVHLMEPNTEWKPIKGSIWNQKFSAKLWYFYKKNISINKGSIFYKGSILNYRSFGGLFWISADLSLPWMVMPAARALPRAGWLKQCLRGGMPKQQKISDAVKVPNLLIWVWINTY